MVNLDELIKELINIVSKTVSDFDNETEELLNILHTQRDEQVVCL